MADFVDKKCQDQPKVITEFARFTPIPHVAMKEKEVHKMCDCVIDIFHCYYANWVPKNSSNSTCWACRIFKIYRPQSKPPFLLNNVGAKNATFWRKIFARGIVVRQLRPSMIKILDWGLQPFKEEFCNFYGKYLFC